jgi:Arc/MetJ family transcription regulator
MDEVYGGSVVKRTNINLDAQLVSQAAALLGTVRVTDTVHAAMRDVVARDHRRRLVESELFTDLAQEDFDAVRSPRTFDE